jgi:hypothetical protein
MDDATLTHLVHKRIHYSKPKQFDLLYKDKILEMTTLLMTTKMSGSLQDAFENYISECIYHFQQKEVVVPVLVKLECDNIMYPKKICVFKNKIKLPTK